MIRGHICHNMFHEMVLEHQEIGNFRWSIVMYGSAMCM